MIVHRMPLCLDRSANVSGDAGQHPDWLVSVQPLLGTHTNGGAAKMPWGGMACLEAPCGRRRLHGIAVRTCRFGAEWAALSAMRRFQLGGGVLALDAASGLSLVHPGAGAPAATQAEEEGCFLRSIDRRCSFCCLHTCRQTCLCLRQFLKQRHPGHYRGNWAVAPTSWVHVGGPLIVVWMRDSDTAIGDDSNSAVAVGT